MKVTISCKALILNLVQFILHLHRTLLPSLCFGLQVQYGGSLIFAPLEGKSWWSRLSTLIFLWTIRGGGLVCVIFSEQRGVHDNILSLKSKSGKKASHQARKIQCDPSSLAHTKKEFSHTSSLELEANLLYAL